MTLYQRGIKAEYQRANELRDQGWMVIRAAGSHGFADLIAFRYPHVCAVQVKQARGIPEVKRAILKAIKEFENGGVWYSRFIVFAICVRYRGGWVILRRAADYWWLTSNHALILGQTVWPITK